MGAAGVPDYMSGAMPWMGLMGGIQQGGAEASGYDAQGHLYNQDADIVEMEAGINSVLSEHNALKVLANARRNIALGKRDFRKHLGQVDVNIAVSGVESTGSAADVVEQQVREAHNDFAQMWSVALDDAEAIRYGSDIKSWQAGVNADRLGYQADQEFDAADYATGAGWLSGVTTFTEQEGWGQIF
jgi:hypothetical protein